MGLGVRLEHKYGHRDLVDMINRFGFCSSYTEASKYRPNAAPVKGVDVTGDFGGAFVQFQVDNVDDASKTIDGYGSTHVIVKAKRVIHWLTTNMSNVKAIGHVHIVARRVHKPVQQLIDTQSISI